MRREENVHSMSDKSLRIGIAGLGTVGGGTVKLLHESAALIEKRCGRKLEVVAYSARENKKRDLPLGSAKFVPNAEALADDPNVDVLVEVIGGSEGVAKALVEKALANKKS